MIQSIPRPEDFDFSRGEHFLRPAYSFRAFSGNAFECRALLCPEPEGGFSVFAMRLPGVMSQGETEEEALANIADAFQGSILAYREAGQEIPWGDVEIERHGGCKERWILVDV